MVEREFISITLNYVQILAQYYSFYSNWSQMLPSEELSDWDSVIWLMHSISPHSFCVNSMCLFCLYFITLSKISDSFPLATSSCVSGTHLNVKMLHIHVKPFTMVLTHHQIQIAKFFWNHLCWEWFWYFIRVICSWRALGIDLKWFWSPSQRCCTCAVQEPF